MDDMLIWANPATVFLAIDFTSVVCWTVDFALCHSCSLRPCRSLKQKVVETEDPLALLTPLLQ